MAVDVNRLTNPFTWKRRVGQKKKDGKRRKTTGKEKKEAAEEDACYRSICSVDHLLFLFFFFKYQVRVGDGGPAADFIRLSTKETLSRLCYTRRIDCFQWLSWPSWVVFGCYLENKNARWKIYSILK